MGSKGPRSIEFAPKSFFPSLGELMGSMQYVYYSSLYRSEHERPSKEAELDKGGIASFWMLSANRGWLVVESNKVFSRCLRPSNHSLGTAAILRRNIEKNRSRIDQTHHIHVFPCALGNQKGRLSFYSASGRAIGETEAQASQDYRSSISGQTQRHCGRFAVLTIFHYLAAKVQLIKGKTRSGRWSKAKRGLSISLPG